MKTSVTEATSFGRSAKFPRHKMSIDRQVSAYHVVLQSNVSQLSSLNEPVASSKVESEISPLRIFGASQPAFHC